jgi:hypothetical protein
MAASDRAGRHHSELTSSNESVAISSNSDGSRDMIPTPAPVVSRGTEMTAQTRANGSRRHTSMPSARTHALSSRLATMRNLEPLAATATCAPWLHRKHLQSRYFPVIAPEPGSRRHQIRATFGSGHRQKALTGQMLQPARGSKQQLSRKKGHTSQTPRPGSKARNR